MFDTVIREEPLGQVNSGIDGLADEDRSGWTADALSQCLTEAMMLRDRLDAEILRLTAQWDGNRAWEADGALSAASWMTYRLPVSRTRAQAEVRTARFLHGHERVAKALSAGDITVDHARILARAVDDRRQRLFADHADALLDAAEAPSISDFEKGCSTQEPAGG